MHPLVQLVQRSFAISSRAVRPGIHTRQLYNLSNARTLSTSPFHRLLARHAERLRSHGLLRFNRRRFADSSKPEPKSASNPNASQHTGSAGASSTSSSGTTNDASLSLSARLRKLSREYGWSVFGVYMALTALDLPLCFLAVRWFGTEKIGQWEHAAVQWVKRAIPFQWPEKWARLKKEAPAEGPVDGAIAGYDHGVREAEEANRGESASVWTQLALAYAIHKSFIFIRVPLTAAITPKVVRTLRGWGWNIGKIKPKAERVAARAERKAAKAQHKAQSEATKVAREAEKRLD